MAITQKGKREIASDVKKKNISDTAISMFRYNGYENTTIADISKATGMSTGSIYNFFGSKEGIITAAIKEPTGYIIYKGENWENNLKDPRGTILKLMMRYADFFESMGPDLMWHLCNSMTNLYNGKDGSFTDNDSVCSLRSFIDECQEAGTVSLKRSAEEYTQIIMSSMQATLLLWTIFEYDIHEKLSYNLDIVFSEMLI